MRCCRTRATRPRYRRNDGLGPASPRASAWVSPASWAPPDSAWSNRPPLGSRALRISLLKPLSDAGGNDRRFCIGIARNDESGS